MNRAQAAPPVCAVLIGASGRMGRSILGVAAEFPTLTLVGALASEGSAALGQDSGLLGGGAPNRVLITSDLGALLERTHVVIDFSRAAATRAHLSACRAAGKPLLLGATGYAAELEADFAAAAREIPLLIAPNTSLGVTLLLELARAAAQALPDFQIEITETHHREKRDAPSGTALALAEAVRAGRTAAQPPAAPAEIPIASRREGEVVGEHAVGLLGAGEELFLTHRATDRAIFARGALAAALWLASRPAGRYGMRDVLYGKTVT
jgi:4-hydroxy-tetrahydrodipicolinate reductase